jgi:putative transposase
VNRSKLTKGQTMQTDETLKPTTWESKYHVVFITKCRQKTLSSQIRRELGQVFRALARQKECEIIEGHLMPDPVPMLVSISPKYSVGQVAGFLKGKTASHIARVYAGWRRSFVGQQFWARGYWVSTVGRDEVAVRRYIREQEKEDQRLERLDSMA